MLRSLLPEAAGKTVVDIGCGTGRTLSLWREQKPSRLIGLDLSPEMLRKARGVSNSLLEADGCVIPIRSGAVDIVSCCLTLGYLPELDGLASEVARVVRSDGLVVISELHPETAERLGWQRGFADHDREVNIRFRNVPIDEVIAAFRRHGFEADLRLEIPFGIAELPLFEAAGKRERFDTLRQHPAIYLLRLRRSASQAATSGRTVAFQHARVALSATESIATSLSIDEQVVCSVGIVSSNETAIDLSDYLLLPGLINAHDHLEFALFPRLGHGPYRNSREWAEEIYRPDKSPLREHLQVPKWVRLWWGGIRNLLCGVTTVCHHNPYEESVFGNAFPVRVLRDFAWAHSVAFDSELSRKHAAASPDIPFIIHAGEGTDETSREELRTLAQAGTLDARTVVVHGNGFDDEGLQLLNDRGAALVWCPSSNEFLFNRTLPVDRLNTLSRKALGSDSPLTSCGDLLDEIRFAAALGASPELLLKQDEGRILPGAVADLAAVRDRGCSPAEALASLSYEDVKLVVVNGRVQLVAEELKNRLPAEFTHGLELLRVNDIVRWVRAPIADLLRLSRQALGSEIGMSGRMLSQ
jgi:cytosine/adenosine deaminase-related metal-dependent hydrolase